MNRFLTFTGEQPIYLGDFDFMQDASASAFKNIARALMNEESDSLNAILQGVEIMYSVDGTSLIWSKGIVVLNGELMTIRSGSASGGLQPLYFHVVEETSGERTFKDGATHECWAERYAIINKVADDGVLVSSVPRLHKSDNAVVFNGTSLSQAVESGKLILKNGMWYCDITLQLVEGSYSSLGSLQFSGLTAVQRNALRSETFNILVPMQKGEPSTESGYDFAWAAVPAQITFSVSGDILIMDIRPLNNNVRLTGGARIQQLLLVY